MRVFIFGIGGTGSRVLRSLTMLLASGVKINQEDLTIVPIVIDADAQNGDTTRTRDLLRSYHSARKTFVNKNVTSKSEMFFNTQIRSFNRLDANTSDSSDLDVQFNFQNQDAEFADFINYNSLSKENKDLMELFYNDSITDSNRELHLNLSVGFKGNPNIGCVVFNGLKDTQQFKNLESSFTANDRIFIISSIFGGTGSSGFPTLVNLIRESKNGNLSQTKIGAITVMPYFNVDADDNSAINSAIFDTKTKAALSFYAQDKNISTINALYYIADRDQTGTLPNVEGGKDQINNSHVVELLSATAILDFINKPDADLVNPQHFEFGAEQGGNPFTISHHFSGETKDKYFKPLVNFAYAAQIATSFIPQLSRETFYSPKELNIDGKLGVPNEYTKLLSFFNEFKKWSASEMNSKDNGRVLNSFNFEDTDHLNNIIHGTPIDTNWLKKGLSKRFIADNLNNILHKESKDMAVPEKYLTTLYKATQLCSKELGQL